MDFWLGFLETMRPRMVRKYGPDAAENIITEVRKGYENPRHQGYNLMYRNPHLQS